VKELFFPAKQAPLPFEVRPVKVKEIWSKDENFGWTQFASIGVHAGVFALILIPFFLRMAQPTQAVGKDTNVTPIDISDYISKLPAGANKAGGGGGANDHTLTPVNKGKLPKFKMTQFTPPQVHPINPNPKLVADASLLGPPDLKVANPNLPTFGDPLANGTSDSLGHGNGTVLEAEPAEDLGRAKTAVRAAERFAQESTAWACRSATTSRIHRTRKKRGRRSIRASWSSKRLSKRTTA